MYIHVHRNKYIYIYISIGTYVRYPTKRRCPTQRKPPMRRRQRCSERPNPPSCYFFAEGLWMLKKTIIGVYDGLCGLLWMMEPILDYDGFVLLFQMAVGQAGSSYLVPFRFTLK